MTDPRPLPDDLPGAEEAVWRYHRHFCQMPSVGRAAASQGVNIVDIAVDALDPCPDEIVAGEAGLTYHQLNAALDRLRAGDPYFDVSFSPRTSRLLSTAMDTVGPRDAWLRLTGVEITDPPPRPRPQSTDPPGYHPPITDYGTPMF